MNFEKQIENLNDKQLYKEMEIRRITDPEQSLDIFVFEEASNQAISELLKKINIIKDKWAKLPQLSEHISEDGDGIPTEKDEEIFSEMADYISEQNLSNEYVKVLSEMKVVCLFRNIEILMRHLIHMADSKINTKDFYKCKCRRSYFKSIGIKLSDLDGYPEIEALQEVNNNIKHNETIGDEVKKIKEFANKDLFTHEDIERFYNRIKPKIQKFIKLLGEAIINNAKCHKAAGEKKHGV